MARSRRITISWCVTALILEAGILLVLDQSMAMYLLSAALAVVSGLLPVWFSIRFLGRLVSEGSRRYRAVLALLGGSALLVTCGQTGNFLPLKLALLFSMALILAALRILWEDERRGRSDGAGASEM
jgi:uncharacterized membrane protein